MDILSKTSFLVFIARLKPEVYDALIPKGLKISGPARHVMASGIIKYIANEIKDPDIAKELNRAGRRLFDSNVKSLYDDDLWPYPRPNWKEIFQMSPYPEPWLWDNSWYIWPYPRPNWQEIFPMGPHPEPWSWLIAFSERMLNPQPLPPEDTYFGALLTILADAISFEDIPDVLRNIGASLVATSGKESNENDRDSLSAV